jgi:16S rRNA (guanine966-N2)-methyltransferase
MNELIQVTCAKPQVQKMGSVQIVSGTLRGRTVLTPSKKTTRPLLSRLRKTLADILRPNLQGARMLDLFGGSGAIAFELLSNGAESAEIVELHAPAAELIRRNAEHLGLQARVRVHCGDALQMIDRLAESSSCFDIILVAPPYGLGLQQQAVNRLASCSLLSKAGLLIAQRDKREARTGPVGSLSLMRTRNYGRTVFEFFTLSPR